MDAVIRRPGREETAEYYFKYIDLVPEGDIREIIESQHRETLAFLKNIPEARSAHRYEPGKWSVAEVVSHINDTERVFAMRAFWFARGLESQLPGFDQDPVVATARASERPWATHVAEFDAVRSATATLFRYLPQDAWTRTGVASGYPFTVRALAYITAGHVMHHTNILRERYL